MVVSLTTNRHSSERVLGDSRGQLGYRAGAEPLRGGRGAEAEGTCSAPEDGAEAERLEPGEADPCAHGAKKPRAAQE